MGKQSFDVIWSRVKAHAGHPFWQIRGKEFTYDVVGAAVALSTTRQNIARSQFEKACELLPFPDTTVVQHLRGPSYLYAILMDQRIRLQDW